MPRSARTRFAGLSAFSHLVAAVLMFATASDVVTAQEWTRFRGPNGAGHSDATTIPAAWTADEVLWKTELPGKGNSSPVLWGDNVFLLSADPDEGTRYVLCLSAVDGSLLWKRDYPSRTHRLHQQNTLASSTPTVDDQHVYCAWSTPEEFTLLALHHDGSPIWQADLGPFASQHGFGTSPVLFEDLLIVTNDQDEESFVIAFERGSGATRWKIPRQRLERQNACYSTPCLYRPQGGPVELILCSRAQGITSIDPRSGKTNWEADVLERRAVSSPIVAAGLILASTGEGGGRNNVVAVRPPTSGNEPELVYKIDKTAAPYVPTMLAKDDLVFLWGDRGVVTCIDAASGTTHWQKRIGGNYFGSPVQVGDRVYCASAEGDVVAIAASQEFELLGRSSLGETCRSTPAVAGGRMFLRTESHLFAVGQE